MKHVYLNKYDILQIENNIKMSYSLNMHMCHGQLKEFLFTKTIFNLMFSKQMNIKPIALPCVKFGAN